MKQIDCNTVKAVEGLAPGVSEKDRKHVSGLVLSGQSFQNFSEGERSHINEYLKGYKGRIPSLSLFFQDVLFLGIAARRVKALFHIQDVKKVSREKANLTVQDHMDSIFHPRDNGEIAIQTSEDEEQHVHIDEEGQFDLAYRQIWLSALRCSSGKMGNGNRLAVLWEWTEPQAQYQLALLASHLGFKSDRIKEIIDHPPSHAPYLQPDFDEDDRAPKLRRCGIPYTKTFREDRETLYIERVHSTPGKCEHLKSAFILQDIYLSFFGKLCSRSLSALNGNRSSEASHCHDTTSDANGTAATSHTASNPSDTGRTGAPSPLFSSRDPSHPADTSGTSYCRTSRQQRSATRASTPEFDPENPQSQDPASATTMKTTPRRISNDGSYQTVNPLSQIEMEKHLQSLLDDLLNKQCQLEESCLTISKQENIINDLRRQQDLAEVQDAAMQSKMDSINADLSEWQQEVQKTNSCIHADCSKVKEELRKLELPADGLTMQEAQTIYGCAQHEAASREVFIREMQIRLPKQQLEIGYLQMRILELRLEYLASDSMMTSEMVDTIFRNMPASDSALPSTYAGAPQARWAELQSLQNIKKSLVVLYNQLCEQTGDRAKNLKELQEKSDLSQMGKVQETWIMESTTLVRNARESLEKARAEIKSISLRIEEEHTSAVLAQVEELATQLQAEQARLEQLRRAQQDQQRNVDSFARVTELKKDIFKQHLSDNSRGFINQLFVEVRDGLKNACITTEGLQNSHRGNAEALESYKSCFQEPIDPQRQLEIGEKCKGMKADEQTRKNEQVQLSQMADKRKNDLQSIHDKLTEAMQQIANTLASEAQEELSEALRQERIARRAESQDEAKHAAETAKMAADNTNHCHKLVLDIKGLVEVFGGSKQLCEAVKESKIATARAFEQASAAAKSARSWAEKDKVTRLIEKACELERQASQLDQKYREHERPSISQTQSVIRLMAKCTNKAQRVTGTVQSHAQHTTETENLAGNEGLIRETTYLLAAGVTDIPVRITFLLFQLLNLITARIIGEMKEEEGRILHLSHLSQQAVDTNKKKEWEAHVNEAQSAMVNIAELQGPLDNANATAMSQKSKIEEDKIDPSTHQILINHISRIHGHTVASGKIQENIRSVMEGMQLGWWKGKAAQKHHLAHDEINCARMDFQQIISSDAVHKEYEVAKEAHLFAMKSWEEADKEYSICRGPEEELRKLIENLDAAYSAATAARKAAVEVLEKLASQTKEKRRKRESPLDHAPDNSSAPSRYKRIAGNNLAPRNCLIIYKVRRGDWLSEHHTISPDRCSIIAHRLCRRGNLFMYNSKYKRVFMVSTGKLEKIISTGNGERIAFLVDHGSPSVSTSQICTKAQAYYELHYTAPLNS